MTFASMARDVLPEWLRGAMFFPNGFEALTHSARWRWLGAEPVGGRVH